MSPVTNTLGTGDTTQHYVHTSYQPTGLGSVDMIKEPGPSALLGEFFPRPRHDANHYSGTRSPVRSSHGTCDSNPCSVPNFYHPTRPGFVDTIKEPAQSSLLADVFPRQRHAANHYSGTRPTVTTTRGTGDTNRRYVPNIYHPTGPRMAENHYSKPRSPVTTTRHATDDTNQCYVNHLNQPPQGHGYTDTI
jgi:hypothetical protein